MLTFTRREKASTAADALRDCIAIEKSRLDEIDREIESLRKTFEKLEALKISAAASRVSIRQFEEAIQLLEPPPAASDKRAA